MKEVTDGSLRGHMINGKYYEGYCIDLIEAIATELGFKYEYELMTGPTGSYNPKTKSWNGLIKRLLDHVCKTFCIRKNSVYIKRDLN